MTTATDNSTTLSQRLSDSGLRSTAQREVVYNVVLSKRDHPTAEEVFARVKAQMPSISLATVYNCLDTLVQCGLIRQVNFEREPSRFCPNLTEHAHFHDDVSGTIHDVDLPATLLAQIRAILPPGYEATTFELKFRGKAPASAPASITPTVPATDSAL